LPWRAATILLILIFTLLATKGEFRSLTWRDSAPIKEDPLGKGAAFLNMVGSNLINVDKSSFYSMAEAAVQRVNLYSMFAFVIEQTPDPVPYWDGETYYDFFWRFVPRIFVPDKPLEGIGQSFGHRYELINIENVRTSVNLPQLVEMYANFGKIGVMVGMFFMGLIYSILHHVLNHNKMGEWGQASAVIIFSSLINIESNFTLVYGGIVYWIVMLWFLGWFVRIERSSVHMQRTSISPI
jgi:hypothetical protein